MWIRYGAVTTIFSVIAFPSTSVLFSHTFNVVILHNSFYSEARIQKPCLDGATGFFGGANRPNRPWVLLLFYICQGWTFEFLGLGGLFVLWTSVSSPEHKPPLSEQSVVRIQAACFARQLRPSNAFLPARIPGFIAVFFTFALAFLLQTLLFRSSMHECMSRCGPVYTRKSRFSDRSWDMLLLSVSKLDLSHPSVTGKSFGVSVFLPFSFSCTFSDSGLVCFYSPSTLLDPYLSVFWLHQF